MSIRNARFLRVNLSSGKLSREEISEEVIMDFIGGRGFGVKFLYEELKPGIDPMHEENKLLLLTGVLAGTPAQGVSRWMACTKSPLTGGFARSVGGADFGAWLRFAGYEFMIIEGKAEKPVYVHLTKDTCEIRDAGEIWGKGTQDTQEWLHLQHGKNTRSACIGPAAEKLVRYAVIISGTRTASRCGVGTVMGSKNIKAVAITAPRSVAIHDPETFKDLAKQQVEMCKLSKRYLHHKEAGTTETQDLTNTMGIYPVKNFRYGKMDGFEKILGKEYLKLRTGNAGCYSCSARCGKVHHVPAGPYANASSEGPEYESIWAFTGTIDNLNIESTIAADQLCDDLGLDTISTGSCIGFAYELFEKGILSKKDTHGLELKYGDHEMMIRLIKSIAAREGIGDILAEGSMRAASILGRGAEAYAIHVKGLELPAYEPRGAKSQGFNFATASIGASHCYGYSGQDIFGSPIPRQTDRFSEEGNEDVVMYNQDSTAMSEVGITCGFARGWGWFDALFGKMLASVTGIQEYADNGYLWKVGERIVNLERLFNVREGFGRKQDTLPVRMLTEPLHTKGAPGEGQMVRALDQFLDRYYKARGWSPEGVPTPQKLSDLHLPNAADYRNQNDAHRTRR